MRLPVSLSFATAGVALTALALSGCASTPAASADGTVHIVASTNVYGDIAEQIGGDLVTVTSFITGAAQDPHSYEASAQDQLALSKASIVIENGGGYDPFIDTLLDAASNDDVAVINASEVSGLLDGDDEHADDEHADEASTGEASTDEASTDEHTEDDGHDHIEGFNEHVWYSFHGVERVAEAIATELSTVDADNADTYEANLAAFVEKIATLEADAETLRANTAGLGAAITEPVPLYLLEEVGLTNRTPDEFSEAIEEGTDVAPLVLQQTLALFEGTDVALLAYNEQTAGAETEQVRDAADAAGIPVVSFSETLPDGADYISWMTENLAAISAAVSPE
ncbi:zinc/manganese transport system substrate-binding protein [Glaciihabitans tibetensis]|uniref:Zinc/manganese transport system substrate-binding protein n=1 Tax=Glaciihabitans tibetensis TaxID=1266600 RepID=A0A2T0VCW0_9MICO|nr:zinc ABC transporter substrate-binding protein [Glaciihabitans tibetensis]PRY68007.1 zinc/manganese transport system substrate-binding protein [Glaciihabitans tibetensis]